MLIECWLIFEAIYNFSQNRCRTMTNPSHMYYHFLRSREKFRCSPDIWVMILLRPSSNLQVWPLPKLRHYEARYYSNFKGPQLLVIKNSHFVQECYSVCVAHFIYALSTLVRLLLLLSICMVYETYNILPSLFALNIGVYYWNTMNLYYYFLLTHTHGCYNVRRKLTPSVATNNFKLFTNNVC